MFCNVAVVNESTFVCVIQSDVYGAYIDPH